MAAAIPRPSPISPVAPDAAWPEKTETYRSLGIALVNLRKADDALAVFREGLDKFPLDNAELWGDIATILDKQKLPWKPPTAPASPSRPSAARGGNERDLPPLARLPQPPDLARLRDMESDLDNHLGRLRAAADKARRDGKAFMNAEAQR